MQAIVAQQLHSDSIVKRRDSTRVIYDILMLTRRDASKTRIVHHANLNFSLAERYIGHLLTRGLVAVILDIRGSRRYRITEKGDRLVRCLEEVQKEMFQLATPVGG